jgi:FAD/FMN-containing dehydrogenase
MAVARSPGAAVTQDNVSASTRAQEQSGTISMSAQNDSGPEGTGWRNWAGNLSSTAGDIPQPSTLAEVQALVRNRAGAKIRAFGTGHSFSPLVIANGEIIVDMSKYILADARPGAGRKTARTLSPICHRQYGPTCATH